jgi:D-psicose/D-tagatose/L-ribulose 3-epimerase
MTILQKEHGMTYGIYYAYWEKEWKADFIGYCKKAADLGFDILEVSAGGLAELNDGQLEKLRETAGSNNITLTACIGLPQEYDLASDDGSVRKNGLEYMNKIFTAMDKAGIKKLGGIVYACWPYDYKRPFDKARARANSIESVKAAADSAAKHGITLMLEIVNRFEHFLLNTAAEGVSFAEAVNRPNVKLLLDCFHMNIEEDSLGQAIRLAGKYLGHFHIGECNRKVPGKGHMPWQDMAIALHDIGYTGSVVMEPFVRMGGIVGSDIKVWRDVSEGADDKKIDIDLGESLRFVKHVFSR